MIFVFSCFNDIYVNTKHNMTDDYQLLRNNKECWLRAIFEGNELLSSHLILHKANILGQSCNGFELNGKLVQISVNGL